MLGQLLGQIDLVHDQVRDLFDRFLDFLGTDIPRFRHTKGGAQAKQAVSPGLTN